MCAPARLPLQVIGTLGPDQTKFEMCMYIERNFSMEVFCLLMGFRKVEDLSKGGRRGAVYPVHSVCLY